MHLENIVMQARKICNHPFLFDWPIDTNSGTFVVNKDLINASGKMLMLNRLLDELFNRGHKVLIFSQFTTMLDIIEEWANEFKNLRTCRIDGTTPQEERRAQMKSFNEDKGPDACNLFLLSTRAGGLGINLVAADTVIFYDSDWNPQMDLQAQDRVHRIGQTRPCLVFRLVSASTVEERILKRAGNKRKLEALVIQQASSACRQATSRRSEAARRRKKTSLRDITNQLLALESEQVKLSRTRTTRSSRITSWICCSTARPRRTRGRWVGSRTRTVTIQEAGQEERCRKERFRGHRDQDGRGQRGDCQVVGGQLGAKHS